MARKTPLIAGTMLHTRPMEARDWTWTEALPLLEVGAQVRLFGVDGPPYELRPSGEWTDGIADQAVDVTTRMCVLVRPRTPRQSLGIPGASAIGPWGEALAAGALDPHDPNDPPPWGVGCPDALR